jgi:hypothetical protein
MAGRLTASSLGYAELEVEPAASARRCCYIPERCLLLWALASLLTSLCFLGAAGVVVYSTVERNFGLFVGAVLLLVETLCFAKYAVDILRLKLASGARSTLWHIARSWIPFSDVAALSMAVLVTASLLPCDALTSFWSQPQLLFSGGVYLAVLACGLVLAIKLVTAAALTALHVRRSRVLQQQDYFWNTPPQAPLPPTAPHSDDD